MIHCQSGATQEFRLWSGLLLAPYLVIAARVLEVMALVHLDGK